MCSLFSDYSRLIYPLHFWNVFIAEKTDAVLVERSGRIMFENDILSDSRLMVSWNSAPRPSYLLIMAKPEVYSIQFCFYWSSIIEYAPDIKQLWSRRLKLPSVVLNPCSAAPLKSCWGGKRAQRTASYQLARSSFLFSNIKWSDQFNLVIMRVSYQEYNIYEYCLESCIFMVQPVDYESHYEMQSHERAVTACFNIMCSRAGSLTGPLDGKNAGMLWRFMASPRPRLTLTRLAHISDSALRVCVCEWVRVSIVCMVCVWKALQYVKGQTLTLPQTCTVPSEPDV